MSNILLRLEFLAQSLFKHQILCPHCLSGSSTTIARKYFLIKITKCNVCGLYFTDPIYKSIFTSNIYNSIYSVEDFTTILPTSNELFNLKNGNFILPGKNFRERIKAIKLLSSNHSILEIGSSWGYFLFQAQKEGLDVTGIEISEPRRLYGMKNLGVDIVNNFGQLDGKMFDFIYTSHALEHFNDISTIFREIHDHLKDNGKLIIEVPNFDYELFGDRILSMIGAVHPLGFSSKFFQDNLPKYGLKIVGFYDSWNLFPGNKITKSSRDNIILLAEKSS